MSRSPKFPTLRIRDWENRFEKRAKDLKTMSWRPELTDLSADLYTDIMSEPDGITHYGVLTVLRNVAALGKPRGTLVRENGEPHHAKSLSRVTRISESLLETVIERLLSLGELENVNAKNRVKNRLARQDDASTRRDTASTEQDKTEQDITGQNRTSHHRTETENNKNGTERDFDHWSPSPKNPEKAFPSVDEIALLRQTIQEFMESAEDIPLKTLAEIKGALRGESVRDFSNYVFGIDAKHRPRGSDPIKSPRYFVTVAANYAEQIAPSAPVSNRPPQGLLL